MLAPAPAPLGARERVGGAATARVRGWLAGPRRIGQVVHAGRDAVYVELPGAPGTVPDVVGVLSRHATHVPCGIRTLLLDIAGIKPGDAVPIGNGLLRLPDHDVVVTRIVDASVPESTIGATQVDRVRNRLGDARQVVGAELSNASLEALQAGDPGAVETLLGRGGGLTPLGDDVLAGWLAAGRGGPIGGGHLRGWDRVADRVHRLAPRRTTLLSRTLLTDAVRGEVIPEFRRMLLDGASAVEPLLRVGHTSGSGLAVGALLALTEPNGSPR